MGGGWVGSVGGGWGGGGGGGGDLMGGSECSKARVFLNLFYLISW